MKRENVMRPSSIPLIFKYSYLYVIPTERSDELQRSACHCEPRVSKDSPFRCARFLLPLVVGMTEQCYAGLNKS